ncbi:MAG: hypothetical protein JGK24_13645 [Microcoleus sp. PH2017_29_MFU_D_A]|uniref:hypothetical protein n=1 Tax=unclassified Microcoleus TaxID=2642155 RepID=UPI001D98C492|nr:MULTISPECIES: hypothetical protein [unclassified Microcoleus]MCC3417472.1 hypothetical protein [Microcoleus sp. PH2017_07_MST_O_A]MCC3430839.1 hypothetical protein [Microcoleus sp. PH2017_04_SCI_O_A]MCC3442716.1 hypothetical protein [Microcoleus sp. PH2017_03_ELD_O_A]MCC3468194.1 hypothetical protein [Microcoleus sp. PH2017_06_SFM_O_A]MCC3505215.1 hypothetical protein [Microcoleus sp. PH2017_19_SFW_U_A]MCC3510203.1 hypothetical protein [Microcoleus sp. PH2017_17_BER_D_A]MCC3572007.1 hypot
MLYQFRLRRNDIEETAWPLSLPQIDCRDKGQAVSSFWQLIIPMQPELILNDFG